MLSWFRIANWMLINTKNKHKQGETRQMYYVYNLSEQNTYFQQFKIFLYNFNY